MSLPDQSTDLLRKSFTLIQDMIASTVVIAVFVLLNYAVDRLTDYFPVSASHAWELTLLKVIFFVSTLSTAMTLIAEDLLKIILRLIDTAKALREAADRKSKSP